MGEVNLVGMEFSSGLSKIVRLNSDTSILLLWIQSTTILLSSSKITLLGSQLFNH